MPGEAFTNLAGGLSPANERGVPVEHPVYDLGRPEGCTFDVDCWTSRPVYETKKSHLNYTVAGTRQWKQAAAFYLEDNDSVRADTKNFDMGFTIRYLFKGERHGHHPDCLVKLYHEGQDLGAPILEVKGYTDDRARATKATADRWINAVNHDGRYGQWDYRVCSDPVDVEHTIRMWVQHLVKLGTTAAPNNSSAPGWRPDVSIFSFPIQTPIPWAPSGSAWP